MTTEQWATVKQAAEQKRHHLRLMGPAVSEAIKKSNGLDKSLFNNHNLSYLNISLTCLSYIPKEIEKLTNLTILVLSSNELEELPDEIYKLRKLRVLDCSHNKLSFFPPLNFPQLKQLNLSSNLLSNVLLLSKNISILNLADNKFTIFPDFCYQKFPCLSELYLNKNKIAKVPLSLQFLSSLKILNLADNKFTIFPDVCYSHFPCLSELYLNGNEINYIPATINQLPELKILSLENNLLIDVPRKLADCRNLKELNLQLNNMYDKELHNLCSRMAETTMILEYLKSPQYNPEDEHLLAEKQIERMKKDLRNILKIQGITDDTVVIKVESNLVNRIKYSYIAACIIKKVNFTKESFKQFIQLRTKLHDGVCDLKKVATIGIHDMGFIAHGNLTYTTKPPAELCIKPLPRNEIYTGEVLFKHLQAEAETVRKITKNGSIDGRYKFLNSLQRESPFPCLMDNSKEIISFPPIVSSNVTKVSPLTKTVFVEVTSSVSNRMCRKVLDCFLQELIDLFGLTDPKLHGKGATKKLIIKPVKVEDTDGNEILTYPSQDDLTDFDENDFIVVHRRSSNQIP